MVPRALRIVLPFVAIAVYYWNFVGSPVVVPVAPEAGPGPGRASIETSRQLAERARAAYNAGRFADAAQALEAQEQQTPSNPIVLGLLAQSYGRLGRWQDAADRWERFLTVSPTPVEACPALPKAYEALGQTDKAFDANVRCYKLEPSNPELAEALARAYLRRGKTDEAAKVMAPVNSDGADTLMVKAQIAIRQNRFADARALLTRALAAHEAYADLHVVMAVLERAEGHREAAIRHCTRALALEPGNADARAILNTLEGAK